MNSDCRSRVQYEATSVVLIFCYRPSSVLIVIQQILKLVEAQALGFSPHLNHAFDDLRRIQLVGQNSYFHGVAARACGQDD